MRGPDHMLLSAIRRWSLNIEEREKEMIEQKNAIITDAEITNDDHGLLTAWLTLDYGGTGQGFGGHSLYLPKGFAHHNAKAGFAGHFLWRVMEIAGVSRWSDLRGKTIRVRMEHTGIEAIGHIVKDDWFYPRVDFAELNGRGGA